MSKTATVASMVRNAARSEEEFVGTMQTVFEEDDVERIADFFDRLNIPRGQGGDALANALPAVDGPATQRVTTWVDEARIAVGIQRFLDRHERKVKWHVSHPALDGAENMLLLVRTAMFVTNVRLRRIQSLLASDAPMTPQDWAIARDLMNRSFLTWRHFLQHLAADWIEAMLKVATREEIAAKLGSFYELIDREIRTVEEMRIAFEDRRLELTVLPEGFPPVRPPNYFGGDLLGKGPWKQYWMSLGGLAHRFRECAA
jgi:hypothetical protein